MRKGGRYIVEKGGKPKLVERTAARESSAAAPAEPSTDAAAPPPPARSTGSGQAKKE